MTRFSLLALLAVAVLCRGAENTLIVTPRSPSSTILLAAKEIRRYVYLRTGVLLTIVSSNAAVPADRDLIIVAPAGSEPLRLVHLDDAFRDSLLRMREEAFCLRKLRAENRAVTIVCGAGDLATLYGAYVLVEKLGVRFYAHGDVIPDETVSLSFPDVTEWHAPLFSTRGLQPFHDFPEGPDWWDLDDYKALFAQMVKMRMNFFGLHTYPEGGVGPEPTVWIGLKEDIRAGTSVATAYPARYFTTTGDPNWGYNPRRTGDYDGGLGSLFETDAYGPEVMHGFTPHGQIGTHDPIPPAERWKVDTLAITPGAWSELFARTGELFASAFPVGRDLGIRICVGTETPLTIPSAVKERARILGKDTADAALREAVYEGIFGRIRQAYPIDHFWFWTPEEWTWSGTNALQIEKTRRDLDAARRAAAAVQAPFSLATCGWVLGPMPDRSLFDTILPKDWAMSCISREVGYEPIDPGFARITDREKWAIPWLEDDPALSIPQLWAGRVRRDAADALAYGCTGLIGIHWRTRVLSPNISALAQAGWRQDGWNPGLGERRSYDEAVANSKNPVRDMPSDDFYLDWASANFGPSIAHAAAGIFARIDGLKRYDRGRASATNMPVPADWVSGPGGVKPDSMRWEDRKQDYRFIDDLEKLHGEVKGPENRERFEYWLNTFRYLRAVGKFACSAGEIQRLIATARKDTLRERSRYRPSFIDLRRRQMLEHEEVLSLLLRAVTTKGELGTVANWQQHIMTFSILIPGREIERLLNQSLPPECWPSRRPLELDHIIVPTLRTSARLGEDYRLKVILPGDDTTHGRLYWRPLGGKEFASKDLDHVNRAVWEVVIPAAGLGDDVEFYLEVRSARGATRYPAGAPAKNQTVVVY